MASFFPAVVVQISWISFLLALIISPAQAASDCTSQTFKSNKVYLNCTDLPTLTAYLHWTYNAANSSLSIAFIAKPAKTDGWVSWGINPTGTKMLGSQALVAYKAQDGTPTVKTYNLSSYSSVVQGKLSFDVWNTSAELNNGSFTIFATVKVPAKAEKLNLVWQVGPGVDSATGVLQKHDMAPANLNSWGDLSLVGTTGTINSTTTGTTNSTTNSTSPAPSSGTPNSTTNNTNSGARGIGSGGINMGLFSALLLLLLGTLIVF